MKVKIKTNTETFEFYLFHPLQQTLKQVLYWSIARTSLVVIESTLYHFVLSLEIVVNGPGFDFVIH